MLNAPDDRRADSLGTRLRRRRDQAGLSQDALAVAAGLTSRALRDIEQDRVRRPRDETVRRLAAALGITTDELGATPPDDPHAPVLIDVLGTMTIRHGDERHQPIAPLPRRILGLLALHHPGGIGVDELVETIWDEPPKSSRTLIHVYLRQIRQLLEPARPRGQRSATVVHRGDRLHLAVTPEQLDLARFDDLARRAAELAPTDPTTAYALLRQALECWRDTAVLGGVDHVLATHPAAVAAIGRRIQAVLTIADLAMRLDRAREAVHLLSAAVGTEPLHEGLHGRLITALAATGEQAQALATFSVFRRRLRDELGIEPGPEVHEAQLAVLRQGGGAPPASARTPAQLPAEAAGYAGRRRQLAHLDEMLRGFEAGGAPGVFAIVGAPGVGKTAMAVRWANRVLDRFADGQLFADLRGNASIPAVRPLEVVSLFLRALGVAADRVPAGLDEAAALFRTLVSDRRLLIVLDDAADVDQVRPLLPGGSGCAVVVTSRSQLSGLVAREGAQRLTLDVLSPDEANGLLARLLRDADVDAQPGAVAELARICGWLPLAIRIAAANLLTREHGTVAEYCAELREGNVLNGLQVDGDDQSAVRAAFALSFRNQPAAARRLFRLLSLMPGADLSAEAVVALAGGPADEASRQLRRLTGMHLVERRTDGRYRLHDLLRRYAGELAAAECDPMERDAAGERLADWFARRADAAATALYPDRLRLTAPDPRAEAAFDDHEAALAWLAAERTNLVELVTRSARSPGGRPAVAWRIADALHGWFALTMHTADWEQVAGAGLQAAVDDGDPRAQVSALLSLGACQWVQGRNEAALPAFERAADLARRCGWLDGEAEALNALGSAHDEEGRPDEAAGLLARARTLTRRSGRRLGEAATVFRIGLLKWKTGDLARAADRYEQAAALYHELGSRSAEAISRTNLGMIYRAMGRPGETYELVSAALAVHRSTGNQVSEAIALCSLAGAQCDLGRYAEALKLARASYDAAVAIGHKRLEANASNAIADVLARTGRLDDAIRHYRQAAELATEAGDRHPEVHALVGLAAAERLVGDVAQAHSHARAALRLSRAAGFRVYQGRALTALAAILLARAELAEARQTAEAALAVHDQCGHLPGAARTHLLLGQILGRLGSPAEAFAHARRARTLFARIGSPEFDEARAARRPAARPTGPAGAR